MPRFLRAVLQLRQAGLAQLVQLGQTLSNCSERSSPCGALLGVTEGFHNKMELINRQAPVVGLESSIDSKN